MGQHSVAEAKNRLSELIDKALQGDQVTITRHGRAVVELRPVTPTPRRVTAQDLDWLAARRAARPPAAENGPQLVRRLRDESEH